MLLAGDVGIGEHGLEEGQFGAAGRTELMRHVVDCAVVLAEQERVPIYLLPLGQVAFIMENLGEARDALAERLTVQPGLRLADAALRALVEKLDDLVAVVRRGVA